jgi:ankyrin repeat protein
LGYIRNKNILNILLKYGNKETLNIILYVAINNNNLNLIQNVINKGANPNLIFYDASLLSHAIDSNIKSDLKYMIVKLLLNNGANASNNYSDALRASKLNYKIAKLLLDNGADPNAYVPDELLTSLRSVALNNDRKMVDLFLEYGGKVTKDTLDGVTDDKMIEYLKSKIE